MGLWGERLCFVFFPKILFKLLEPLFWLGQVPQPGKATHLAFPCGKYNFSVWVSGRYSLKKKWGTDCVSATLLKCFCPLVSATIQFIENLCDILLWPFLSTHQGDLRLTILPEGNRTRPLLCGIIQHTFLSFQKPSLELSI